VQSTTYVTGDPGATGEPVLVGERPRSTETRSFRPDVEGLRAIAILVVVLYHAGVTWIPGGYVGVDVFFVISGFVITMTLTRELGRDGRISIAGFYARRALRLLPAASAVIIVTLVASWLWLPPLLLRGIAQDALACTLYAINYRLALVGVDYFAVDVPSPFQHFWSLAVEEQFYFVWPLLLMLLATGAVSWRRARHRSLRIGRTATVLVAIIIVSFVACVWLTQRSLPWAYFSAPTRAWELGIGALVAIGARRLARLPALPAAGLTWLGLAALVGSALWFTDATAFPGYAAALPVVGTGLVIAGGCAAPRFGAETLLRTPVFQGIGKVSYSWYLWHWPVLIIAPYVLGTDLPLWQRLSLVAGSLAVAVVSYVVLENPIRTARSLKRVPWRALALGGSLSASTAVIALIVATVIPLPQGGPPVADLATSIEPHPTAQAKPTPLSPTALAAFQQKLTEAIRSGLSVKEAPANLTPALADAKSDVPPIYPDGCDPGFGSNTVHAACQYGDLTSSTVVVLYGDSHAGQWFPAVNAIALKYHWKLQVITKSACSPANVPIYSAREKREYSECDRWRVLSEAKINKLHPAMVVMTSHDTGSMVPGDQAVAWSNGWHDTINSLTAPGTHLVLISDTPLPKNDAALCVSAHVANVGACNATETAAFPMAAERQAVASMAQAAGATVIDPSPWFCVDGKCPVIVGNILVYKDNSHVTTPYVSLVTPLLEAQLVAP
jgi:peptidoglycan/LPS O-acetylase OafA/YrhL